MVKYKRCLPLLFLWVLMTSASDLQAYVQPAPYPADDINADSWVVMDVNTGEILIEKNMNKKDYPASITKIVTTIMAIEERSLDEVVTVSQHAADTIGSSLSLQAGDQIRLEDLLYGMVLHSGNDGAVAVAEHISPSETEFAKKMTSFANSIGAKNTNFMNASGLPNEQHYTTAYDMAIITRYAMKNPIFQEIVKTISYKWEQDLWNNELKTHEKTEAIELGIPWTGEPQVVNHNRLLTLYEGATGVKNGFTHESRYTVVGSAKRNERELIAVILRSNNADTAYEDIKNLLDRGFAVSLENLEQNATNKEDPATGSEDKQSSESASKAVENNTRNGTANIDEKNRATIKNQVAFLLILGLVFMITIFKLTRKEKSKEKNG